ncbi:hypothetical protein B9G69_001820 [Bdellovibrio sp. SKB1291214]|uniref:hypothetical protein n=1 Tax=Bdellovibrio sp. SKB1291214 TaxID=1732569 RepID=UPI000B51DF51|nr:hypothetical protein [Bdellovibrio sp. SKB1291214]UYL09308.1 hypothetical protein B9G69_001820 [Bdellovibrio sp. SKB1291214]
MRTIIFFVILLFITTTTHAETCARLTGVFQMAEGAVVKFESDGCDRLIRWSGYTSKKGEIVISPEKMVYHLDGTPLCTGRRCQSAVIYDGGILFSLNYEGYVKTPDHGLCIHREYKISITNNNSLQTHYEVHDCDDGFSGKVLKVFPRLPDL